MLRAPCISGIARPDSSAPAQRAPLAVPLSLHPTPGRSPLLICQYWVPRIQLLFCAEDPRVFTRRVVEANALRKNTEALLLYNLYVDCMPSEGQRLISEQSLNKIKQWAMSTPRMRKGPA